MHVSIAVNGERSPREIEPRQLLVHFIRETPGLTGARTGAATPRTAAPASC